MSDLMRILGVFLSVILGLLDVAVVMFGLFSLYCTIWFYIETLKTKAALQKRTNQESAIIYAVFTAASASIAFVLTAGILMICRGM